MAKFLNTDTMDKRSAGNTAQRAAAMIDKIEELGLSTDARLVAAVLADQADAEGVVQTTPWMMAPVARLLPREAAKALFDLELYDIIEGLADGPGRYKILQGWQGAGA